MIGHKNINVQKSDGSFMFELKLLIIGFHDNVCMHGQAICS